MPVRRGYCHGMWSAVVNKEKEGMRDKDGAKGKRTQDKNANQTQPLIYGRYKRTHVISAIVWLNKGRNLQQGSMLGSKIQQERGLILNDNNQGIKKWNYKTSIGADITRKETTATAKERPKLLSGGADKGILWSENNDQEIQIK